MDWGANLAEANAEREDTRGGAMFGDGASMRRNMGEAGDFFAIPVGDLRVVMQLVEIDSSGVCAFRVFTGLRPPEPVDLDALAAEEEQFISFLSKYGFPSAVRGGHVVFLGSRAVPERLAGPVRRRRAGSRDPLTLVGTKWRLCVDGVVSPIDEMTEDLRRLPPEMLISLPGIVERVREGWQHTWDTDERFVRLPSQRRKDAE